MLFGMDTGTIGGVIALPAFQKLVLHPGISSYYVPC